MSKILKFETREQAHKQLVVPLSEKNLESITEFVRRYHESAEEPQPQKNPIGEGLEMTYIIELTFEDNNYHPSEVTCNIDPHYYNSESYKKISDLVKAVKREESKPTEYSTYGATVNTVFYTLPDTELPVYTEQERQSAAELLSNPDPFKQAIEEELKELPLIERIRDTISWKVASMVQSRMLKHLTREILKSPTYRGLTAEETEEFERLYFNEETPQ